MSHKQIAFGIVGLAIGFVAGFFVSKVADPAPQVPVAVAQAPTQSGPLPEGHPPVDLMNQVQEMEAHAVEHPEHAEIKVRLGNAYYDLQRFDMAIKWYEEALKQEPENVNVNTDLGTAYFANGDIEKAIATLNTSLQMEENHPLALQNLGWIHFSASKFDEAIQYWEKLIEAHPDFRNIEEVQKQLETARSHKRGEHS